MDLGEILGSPVLASFPFFFLTPVFAKAPPPHENSQSQRACSIATPPAVVVGSLWPYGPLRSPRVPCFTSGTPVPSGPSGVSLDPPVRPPVPLVSLGSYSSIAIV